MEKNSSKGGLAVLIIVAVLAVLISVLGNFSSSSLTEKKVFSGTNEKSFTISSGTKPYIATVYITGVIQEKGGDYNQAWLLDTIRALKNDDKNKGILLFIDSPGGAVYQADEAYLELLKYKATGKNVYAYFGSMAASGGYYIGCAADTIYANRNSLTGSIGVISSSSVDATSLLEKLGLKTMTIHSGRNKNMLNYDEPPTEEQIEIMQSISDEAYDQFTQIVSESRAIPIDTVRELADGRIYTARQAKANGLIDEIFTFEQTQESIKADFSFDNLTFREFRYEKNETLRSMLLEGFSAIKNPAAVFNTQPVLSYIYLR